MSDKSQQEPVSVPHILTESPYPNIKGRTDRDVLRMCSEFLQDMHCMHVDRTIAVSIWLLNEVQHALGEPILGVHWTGHVDVEKAETAELKADNLALTHALVKAVRVGMAADTVERREALAVSQPTFVRRADNSIAVAITLTDDEHHIHAVLWEKEESKP